MKRAAIVLAGGQSSRMGSDKWTLSLEGKSVAERIIHVLAECCSPIYIVVANPSKPFETVNKQVEIIHDLVADCGPLGGVYTGLSHSEATWNLVTACDMPFVSKRLVELMFQRAEETGSHVIVPEWGGKLHPLHAVYSKECLERLKAYVFAGGRKVMEFVHTLQPLILSEQEVQVVDPQGLALFNMNRPDDYAKAKQILRD